jgi:hypothetical protein
MKLTKNQEKKKEIHKMQKELEAAKKPRTLEEIDVLQASTSQSASNAPREPVYTNPFAEQDKPLTSEASGKQLQNSQNNQEDPKRVLETRLRGTQPETGSNLGMAHPGVPLSIQIMSWNCLTPSQVMIRITTNRWRH